MLNQGRIKCVKFCPQTKIIDFYKDDKPIWISSSKQKIEKIKPSCDVFIKSNSEKLDEETKRNDEILSRLDKDDFNSTLPSNRKKLEELKEVNKKWKLQIETSKNEQILNEADLRSEEIYVNTRRISSSF